MGFGIGGGIFTLLFLWGLWEWCEKRKRQKALEEERQIHTETKKSKIKLSKPIPKFDERTAIELITPKNKSLDGGFDPDEVYVEDMPAKPDRTNVVLLTIIFVAIIVLIILGVAYFL